MLHVRSRGPFTVWHLTEQTSRRLGTTLMAILRISTESRKKTAGAVDGVGDFVGDRLVEWNRASVTLNWVVGLVTALILALNWFAMIALALALTVSHLFLALALDDLAFSGVPLPLTIELGRRMLHRLPDAREGVPAAVGRTCGVLAIG
jgi:hypothetical protein